MDRLAFNAMAAINEERLVRQQLSNDIANVSTVGFKQTYEAALFDFILLHFRNRTLRFVGNISVRHRRRRRPRIDVQQKSNTIKHMHIKYFAGSRLYLN